MDGWVVLFSPGRPCDFYVAGKKIKMMSGDALVFNRGEQHEVMHGVQKIYDAESPDWVPRQMEGKRIGLQVLFNDRQFGGVVLNEIC
jgi:hypothetical protein